MFNINKILLRYLLLASIALLSACTSTPVKNIPASDWQSRQQALAAIDSWKMHARIGLRSNDRSGSATMIWNESPQQRSLRLIGPLGGGLVLLQQDATGISMRDSKGKNWHGTDAADLIYRATGWRIPVTGLRWWLMGLSEPDSLAVTRFDPQHRLSGVEQAGWKVTLSKYAFFGDYELPTSLLIETTVDKEHERYLRVKVIVKDWNENIYKK